jgi:hypothetical protein
MLTESERRVVKNYIYNIIKEHIEEITSKSKDDKKEKSKSNDYSDKRMQGRVKEILPVLNNSYDKDVNTYNLTRSQLAYELYPNLDKDSARSKLSQKINGRKNFKPKELNKLANIISGDIA